MLLKEMSDEDLIFLINAGSELALTTFYTRYHRYSKNLASEYAKTFKDSGIQEDEFFAIAFERVQHAIEKYENIQKKFVVYWRIVVKNAIYDYVRVNSYQSGGKIYGGVSLDSEYFVDKDSNYTFHDAIGERDEENELKELLETYLDEEDMTLTNEEKLILKYFFLEERTIEDIHEITNLSCSRIKYLTRGTRSKIQKIIKENYL